MNLRSLFRKSECKLWLLPRVALSAAQPCHQLTVLLVSIPMNIDSSEILHVTRYEPYAGLHCKVALHAPQRWRARKNAIKSSLTVCPSQTGRTKSDLPVKIKTNCTRHADPRVALPGALTAAACCTCFRPATQPLRLAELWRRTTKLSTEALLAMSISCFSIQHAKPRDLELVRHTWKK